MKSSPKKTRDTRHVFWALILSVLCLVVLLPLLRKGFYISDDGEWMVIRLTAFYQSLASGQFPVRFLGRLNHNYGYPVANFLYPGFMYLGSLLHIAGLSFVDAVKVIMGFSVLLSGMFTYYALRRQYGNTAGFAGGVSMLFAPYLSYDLYVRGSVGEILALLPASAIMYAISANIPWLLPPMIAFLLISHNTAALLFALVFAVLVQVKYGWRAVTGHVLVGVGMASFFWAPALYERMYVHFNEVTISDPSRYFITPDTVWLIGLPFLISIVLFIGNKSRKTVWDTTITALVVISIGMTLPVAFPLWNLKALVTLVQFPFRFLILPVLLGPWIVAHVFRNLRGWKVYALIAVFAVFWFRAIYPVQHTVRYVDRETGYYTTNEGTTTVADEYMPRWAARIPEDRMHEAVQVIDGNVNIESRRFPKENIQTVFEAKTQGVIQINKIYYPGWRVAIDNIPVTVRYTDNPFGFMQIDVPEGSHSIRAAFRETPERFVADVISAVSAVVYLVFLRRLAKPL